MKKIPRPDLAVKLSPMTPRAHRKWLKGRTIHVATVRSWRHPTIVDRALLASFDREENKARRSIAFGGPVCGPIDFAAQTLARFRARAVAPPVIRVHPAVSLAYAYKNPRHMRAA